MLPQYLMSEFDKWKESLPRERVGQYALFCVNDCVLREVNGRPVNIRHARKVLGCGNKRRD